MSRVSDDSSFGPLFGSSLDFTLLFEHAILTLTTTFLFIGASSVYIYCERDHPTLVHRGSLFWLKQVTGAALVILQTLQLIFWAVNSSTVLSVRNWAIATCAISLVADLYITAVLFIEHRKSIRPAALLSIYCAASLLVDLIRSRSYLLRSGLDGVGIVQVLIAAVKAGLIVLEEIPKTSLVINKELRQTLSRESVCGFWSKTFAFWLNPTFFIGFRQILCLSDLGKLSPDFFTSTLTARFEKAWKHVDHKNRYCLMKAVFQTCYMPFLSSAIPLILFTICSLSQPSLFYLAIDVVNDENLSTSKQTGLVLATLAIYGGMAMFRSMHNALNNRTNVFIRGVLSGIICAKTLRLPAKETTKGASMTLSSTDLESVLAGVILIHKLWISVAELCFIMYFLWIYIRYACFLLFIPTAANFACTMFVGPIVGTAQKTWNASIQDRVGQTTQILAQAKQVKTLGLQADLTDYIQTLRFTELRKSSKLRKYHSFIVAMAMTSESLTPVIILAGALFITKLPLPLDANRIFAILAIVQLSVNPFGVIVTGYAQISSLVGCFDRIQTYLLLPEKQDERTRSLPSRSTVPTVLTGIQPSDVAFIGRPVDAFGASIAYEGSDKPVLKNVDFVLPRGQLIIAKGPNGGGKSTLLKAIVGEGKICSGALYVFEGSVAFCDQTAWLRNCTIRENITSYSQFDQQWYTTVLEHCCLTEDLRQLPDGDQTIAGNNGSKLSGGQRLRVALARAIYSRPQLLVLDDPFSAIDRQTTNQLFCGLFNSDGLLRKLNATVLISTHDTELFGTADVLLNLRGNGSVCMEKGNSQDLERTTQPPVASVGVDTLQSNEESSEKVKTVITIAAEKQEIATRNRSDFSIYRFFFSTAPTWMFVSFILGAILTAACERICGVFLRWWLQHDPDKLVYFAIYGALGVLPACAFGIITVIFFQLLVPRYGANMHKMLVDSMLGATVPFLTAADHGVFINRVSQHMTNITQEFARCAFKIPYSTANVVAIVIIIASASYYALVLIPVFAVVLFILQLVYLRTSRQMRLLDLEAKTPTYSLLAEIGDGVGHVRAFSWQSQFMERAFDAIDIAQNPFYLMSSIQLWLSFVLDMINTCIALVLICFAVFWSSHTTQSGLGLSFVTLMGLGSALTFFMNNWIAIETSLGAIAGVRDFVKETPVEESRSNEKPVSDSLGAGAVTFDNVTAWYKTGHETTTALSNLCMEIPPRSKVALRGRTGSGKSSIFLAMLNCLDYKGTIKIDGQELSTIPLNVLRQKVALCPQDNMRLPGTIRENLMPWLLSNPKNCPFSDDRIDQVLQEVALMEVVEAAGGLDASMEGLGLSAGQNQLFSIARTILAKDYRGSCVILMDEGTSNLDDEMEGLINSVVETSFKDCTVIMIAHRPGAIACADIVFDTHAGKATLHGSANLH